MAESSQRFLERRRSPRLRDVVQIAYDTEMYGPKKLPFVVGVLADLSGQSRESLPHLKDRKFIEVDASNFDSRMRHMEPRIRVVVSNILADDGSMIAMDLRFCSMADFEPSSIIHQIPSFCELLSIRQDMVSLASILRNNDQLNDALQEALSDENIMTKIRAELKQDQTEQPSETVMLTKVLDLGIATGWLGSSLEAKDHGKLWLARFFQEVLSEKMVVSRDTEAMINAYIADIDAAISHQLRHVMHTEAFQKLEASWRGLYYLVTNTATSENLRIRVFNVSKKELADDLRTAVAFDRGVLYEKVYEDAYGAFGGEPYAVLLGDYEFSHDPCDVDLLEGIANIAAVAHTPFIAAVSPVMFGMSDFTKLYEFPDIGSLFQSSIYSYWRSFRERENSRYVGLVLPHFLLRLPYSPASYPTDPFNFDEGVDGTDHSHYLWGNAVYAFGTRLTNAFATYGWCAAIRGVESGGAVEDLPMHIFSTTDGEIAMQCPTEVAITSRRELELAHAGFIPLCHRKNSDMAAFLSACSCHKPKLFDDPERTQTEHLWTQLQYVMALSRFAHYLGVIMRDKQESFATREDFQRYLNSWIMQYVTGHDSPAPEIKARHPLLAARVEVRELPEKLGAFFTIAWLVPHFQLEPPPVAMQLSITLPSSRV